MTVTNTEVRSDAFGNGVATSFGYDFLVQTADQMAAYFDGVAQPPGGFTVNDVGNPLGGTVVFDVAPADGVLVTLIREAPETQETDYVPYDSFPAETHEAALDKLTLLVQQLTEENLRKLGYGIVGAPSNGTQLPDPEPNKAIGYDGSGQLANVAIGIGGTPVVNPLQEDLQSGNYAFVITDGVPVEKGRILDGPNGIEITTPELTANGELVLTDAPNDGAQYVRESAAWSIVDVPPPTVVSDTPPATPRQGQFWFRSDIGRLYMRYNDANSNQWVEVGPAPGASPIGTPPGGVIPYAGSAAPSGWLICDGASYNGGEDEYAILYAVIGTTYGGSDPVFQVPDLRGRVVAGLDAPRTGRMSSTSLQGHGVDGERLGGAGGTDQHILTSAEMPLHTHGYTVWSSINTNASGGSGISGLNSLNNAQTTGSAGGNQPHNNVQPTLVLNYIIKL